MESADRRSDIAWSAEIVSGRTRAEGIGARVGIVLALAAICPPTADVAPASLLLAQPLGQLGELAFARRAFLPESFTFFTAGRDR